MGLRGRTAIFVRYGPPYCLPATHSPTLAFHPLVHIACKVSDDFEFAWLERPSFPFSALIPVSRRKRFRKRSWYHTGGFASERSPPHPVHAGPPKTIEREALPSHDPVWWLLTIAEGRMAHLAQHSPPYVIRPIYTLAFNCDCDSPLVSSYHPLVHHRFSLSPFLLPV